MTSRRATGEEFLVDALAAYRRPGTPIYTYHFRNLPETVLQPENAAALRAILQEDSLPARVREHAAGALGELRDPRAVAMLIGALDGPKLRRGAAVALGLIRDRRAVPALIEVACQTEHPGQAQMAIVCIEKILRCRQDAEALGAADRSRLERQLEELKRSRTHTPLMKPRRPWERVPGSPGWFAALDRATKALERLLARGAVPR